MGEGRSVGIEGEILSEGVERDEKDGGWREIPIKIEGATYRVGQVSQLEEKNVTIEELEDEENVETVHERIIEIVLADSKQESEALMIEVPEGFVNTSSAIDVSLPTSQAEETRDAEICVTAATKGEELLIPIDQTVLIEKAHEVTTASTETSLTSHQKHFGNEEQMVSAGLEADQETAIKEQIKSDVEQILSEDNSSTSSRTSFSSEVKRLSREEESQLKETSEVEDID